MQKERWIVVANSTKVRIFRLESKNMPFEIETLIHPVGRLHERDLVTDKAGELETSVSEGRYAAEPQTTFKQHESQIFAKEVVNYLEKARKEGLIERLYIAATPSFLGYLRQEMSPHLESLVEATVDKDITYNKPEKICEYFPIGL